jgi:hypothetical protein
MDLLVCGHAAISGDMRTCVHLLVEDPPEHVRLLTGEALGYDLLCMECADSDESRSHLLEVCEGCADRADDSSFREWRGTPEVRHRDLPAGGRWSRRDCPLRIANERCLVALPDGWLVLTAEGLFELIGEGIRHVAPAVLPAEPIRKWAGRVSGPALHVAADGRYAAVVNDYGQYGLVVDVTKGSTVVTLDRGSYHVETTPFPVTFVGTGGSTVLIAATDWNRLDAFDAATGRLLSDRDTAWVKGENRPEHYLDYFHGRLTPSPSGRHVLDDGWVWHPVGIPTLIDVEQWLDGDKHAAEHGTTIAYRDYAWDQPVAWLGNGTVVIQRIGTDDEAMLDGVQLFDAVTCSQTGVFAGPAGPMWAHDGHLYVTGPSGLEVWDAAAGARIGHIPGFRPSAQNRLTGALAELAGGQLRVWEPTAEPSA